MKIDLRDGAGGRKMNEFISEVVLSTFGPSTVGDIGLAQLDDGASFDNYIITTDGHTVKPLFFRGGNVGTLAACGTINDVSVMGARPLLLTSSLIIQAGFERDDLVRILEAMKASCDEVEAQIVAGDTKVVEDPIGLYATTTGVGRRWKGLDDNIETVRAARDYPSSFITDSGLEPGDVIIASGTIGDHGVSILSERDELSISGDLSSDVAPVWGVVRAALEAGGVTAMKDPTRGGIAGALNEMASKAGCGMIIREHDIPVKPPVRAASEILGINPFEVANEGKVVMAVMPERADRVLRAIHATTRGADAAVIGRATDDEKVLLETEIGAQRLFDMPESDPVPRVC
ncbi:MAG TPA: hydrogenase expression/formation protein HypE [Methanomicrobia archaeon]|nr:hydrogenase expression/formation protein HypE [Methanomicrobia archaeon]